MYARLPAAIAVLALVAGGAVRSASAAERWTPIRTVVDWNEAMVDALEVAHTPPPPAMRIGAIVQAAVFDAVNGITRRYTSIHVQAHGPRGARASAAAAGAAHEALSALFPDQRPAFDALLATSLARIRHEDHDETAIQRGLAWGVSVADDILAWRAGDGFGAVPATYLPNAAPGRWQPTPPLYGPPAFRQFATMTPFTLTSPAQFGPPPPAPLTSARYARDFREVATVGSATSATRSAFDTQTATFWQADTPVAIWDRVTDGLLTDHRHRRLSLTDAARLLALTNLAMVDTVIAIWYAKNRYDTWRPITAIQRAGTDGNPRTTADPDWQPLLVTPSFQEYPAGHPGVSQAAAAVLAHQFGDRTQFTATSAGLPGVVRVLPSFSAGVAQVIDARVLGGIHFRFAGEAATATGRAVAWHVLHTQMRRAGTR